MTIEERYIDEFRQKMEGILDNFTLEDFKRIHSKFFGGLIALEIGFARRFPKECEEYLKETYNEE